MDIDVTPVLRILLIIGAVLMTASMLCRIRKARVRMGYAIFWLIFSLIILILAIFPGLAGVLARLVGIRTSGNFIFMFIIALLIVEIFSLTVRLSEVEAKLYEKVEQDAADKGVETYGPAADRGVETYGPADEERGLNLGHTSDRR